MGLDINAYVLGEPPLGSEDDVLPNHSRTRGAMVGRQPHMMPIKASTHDQINSRLPYQMMSWDCVRVTIMAMRTALATQTLADARG